jgi:hypothetical protein
MRVKADLFVVVFFMMHDIYSIFYSYFGITEHKSTV